MHRVYNYIYTITISAVVLRSVCVSLERCTFHFFPAYVHMFTEDMFGIKYQFGAMFNHVRMYNNLYRDIRSMYSL